MVNLHSFLHTREATASLRLRLLLLLLGNLCGSGSLLLRMELVDALDVLLLVLLALLHLLFSLRLEMATALQRGFRHKPLNLRGLGLLLALDGAANHELADIVLLLEVEELLDVGRALRSEAAGLVVVSETRDFLSTLLDNDKAENGQIGAHDATTHGLALAAALAALPACRHALFEEEAHAGVLEDALLHWEALLVVPTRNAKDIPLELIAKGVTRNLCSHALVVKWKQLLVVIDLQHFLLPRGWVCKVELHGARRRESQDEAISMNPQLLSQN